MKQRVLVFGSYVTDLCGRTQRFPEAGETVKGNSFRMGPGGKGSNQAIAAHRAGANVTFITKLGDDALGRQALEFYRQEKLPTEGVIIDPEEQTGAALITVNAASAQNQIVVVGGACEHFTDGDISGVLEQLERSDILLLQLETNLEPVRQLLRRAKELGIMTILNPAPFQQLELEYLRCVDIITPNETEAGLLTGVRVADGESVRAAARNLLDSGAGSVVITLGENGCYACDGEKERFYNSVDCGTPVDTTGAGDAFSGGLTAALARGLSFFEAVEYGTVVAGLAVTRLGTAPAMPREAEIERVYSQLRAQTK